MIWMLILSAVLSALVLGWILAPDIHHRRTLTAAFILALLTIGLYLWAGSPY